MRFFITVSSESQVLSFFSLPDWNEEPDGAVEVDESQFNLAAAATYGAKWTGSDVQPNPVPDPPVPTQEQIRVANSSTRDAFLSSGAFSMAPLQDAVDLGIATDEETALLTSWKQYRVAVNRVDLSQASPVWPTAPAS